MELPRFRRPLQQMSSLHGGPGACLVPSRNSQVLPYLISSVSGTSHKSKTIEGNQAPRDIIGTLMRKKVPDKMAAATRDDLSPILRILLELVPLERIDLIANETGNRRCCPPVVCSPLVITQVPTWNPSPLQISIFVVS